MQKSNLFISYIIGLIFLVGPLLYDASLFLVFDLPKRTWLLAGIELVFAVWLISKLYALTKRKQWQLAAPSPRWLLFLGLVAASILATLVAYNPHQAFWGNYYRAEGLWLYLHYFALFLLSAALSREAGCRRVILAGIALGGVALSWMTLAEYTDLLPYAAWKNPAAYEGRLVSPFGQPNIGASYLALALPACLSFWLSLPWKYKAATSPLGIAYAYAFLATGSRGAFLALLAVALVFSGIYGLRKLHADKKVPLARFAALGAALLLISGVFYGLLARNQNWRWRITELTQPANWTKTERYQIWQRSLELIARRPWWGYGFDNFELVFPAVIQEGDLHLRELFVDRAHSIYVESLVSFGIWGSLCLFGMFAVALFAATPLLQDSQTEKNWLLRAGLLFYLFYGMVNFTTPLAAAPVWIYLGMLFAASPPDTGEKQPFLTISCPFFADNLVWKTISVGIVASVVCGTCVRGIWLNGSFLRADRYHRETLSWELVSGEAALPYAQHAVAANPQSDYYRIKLFDLALRLAFYATDAEQQAEWYRIAAEALPPATGRDNQSADSAYRYSQLYAYGRDLISPDWQDRSRYYALRAAEQAPYKYPPP